MPSPVLGFPFPRVPVQLSFKLEAQFQFLLEPTLFLGTAERPYTSKKNPNNKTNKRLDQFIRIKSRSLLYPNPNNCLGLEHQTVNSFDEILAEPQRFRKEFRKLTSQLL